MKILITGATSGIGFSLAKSLTKRGHEVVITTHLNSQLKLVNQKIKEGNLKIKAYQMDITNKEERILLEKVNPDVLVNHAGIGNGGSLLDMDIDILRNNYEVNIFSSFELLKEFYHLKEKKGESGKVFVTSSIASMLPIPYLGCYTSSKAAISMLTKTIQLELKPRNRQFSISLIEPGAYHTGFNQVMIDNKKNFMNKDSKVYTKIDSIIRLQRNMFILIEKQDTAFLIKKVVKEIESEHPKFKIRVPFLQGLFAKIAFLFYR